MSLNSATANRKHAKPSNATRRTMLQQRSFIATDRAAAADEFDLLSVVNAMAHRPRNVDTIDAAVMAIWCQLSDGTSLNDADLRAFVVRYEWIKRNDLLAALFELGVVADDWKNTCAALRKGK